MNLCGNSCVPLHHATSCRIQIQRPEVDAASELAPWFVSGLPRPALKLVATQLVSNGKIGDFIVRDVRHLSAI